MLFLQQQYPHYFLVHSFTTTSLSVFSFFSTTSTTGTTSIHFRTIYYPKCRRRPVSRLIVHAARPRQQQPQQNPKSSDDCNYYNFWEESLSIQSFNMDLHNLAMDDPQKAQDALEIMELLYDQEQQQHQEQENGTKSIRTATRSTTTTTTAVVQPNSASYTTVMEGWCFSNHRGALLMEEPDPAGGDPTNEKRTTVVTGYPAGSSSSSSSSSSSTSSDIIAHRVQALLDRMEEAPHLQPNEISYLLACQQWADAVNDETPVGQNIQRAQNLLDFLLLKQSLLLVADDNNDGNEENDDDDDDDDTSTSSTTTTTTSNSRRPRSRRRRKTIPISTKLYTIVMEGWCRRVGKVPHAMERVETMLKDMEEAAMDDNSKNPKSFFLGLPRPNVLTYTSVIGGLARSRQRDLATKAMALLPRMKAHGVEPDMVAYTSILNCWAKTTSRDERQQAHTQALTILQKMEDAYAATDDIKDSNITDSKNESGDPWYLVKPNAITYATAIKAIGNSFAENAPVLAEEVLQRMYNLTESGVQHVPPTVETYNAVIMSLSSASASSPSSSTLSNSWNRSARAQRAEHWLVEMIKRSRNGELAVAPNVRTWGAVLKAWADSGRPDSGEQAQRVLDLMEDWYEKGSSSVKPNVICYTTVINAWSRGSSVSSKVALTRVEQLLKNMEDLYRETGDTNVRPNKISYVSVMDAYGRKCKKGQAAIKSQELVDRMMKLYASDEGYVRPTRIIFNALINAYSKSDDPGAAAQAEKLFRWMEARYRAGDDHVQPDEITLCGVLNAWANHAAGGGGARRAQAILDHTEALSLEERGFLHSIVCHNIVIKAWGRSRELDSVQRAAAILNKLEQSCQNNGNNSGKEVKFSPSICPDVTTYSSVINCCAYYSGHDAGRQQALDIALQTFSKIQKDRNCEGPNHITFGTVLKAIAKLMPIGSERDSLVESIFEQCKTLGQVDSFVLSQVKAASSAQLFRKLVLEAANHAVDDGTNYDKILKVMPREWTASIV